MLKYFCAKWEATILHHFEQLLIWVSPQWNPAIFLSHSSFLVEAQVPVILKAFAQHVKHCSEMHLINMGKKNLFASHITYIMWHFQVKQHIHCEKCRAGLDFYPTGFDWKVKRGRYKNGLRWELKELDDYIQKEKSFLEMVQFLNLNKRLWRQFKYTNELCTVRPGMCWSK